MIKLIIGIVFLFILIASSCNSNRNNKNNDSFIDGGDEITDEDLIMMEILEDDEE